MVLLGPQRLRPTLASVVEKLGIRGRIAAVTAGWEDRESDDRELSEHLGGRTVNLELYARVEHALAADPELERGYRGRHRRLVREQQLYRYRLTPAMEAVRGLQARDGDDPQLTEHREAALAAVRRLDREHLDRIDAIHAELERDCRPGERDAVVAEREAVRQLTADAAALAIAGGHVAVLIHRMRLLGVLELIPPAVPLIAWSAGAMALATTMVAFHDSPPQGAGNAEVVERGLAAYPDVIPFPHARRRLRLDDRGRIALLARRLAPAICIPLDEGSELTWSDRWSAPGPIERLNQEGVVVLTEPESLTSTGGGA